MYTAKPKDVAVKMKELLFEYNTKQEKIFDDLLDFHYKFECIHHFQDGNGRIGRLLLFKECLKYNIVPFIIDEELKLFYYIADRKNGKVNAAICVIPVLYQDRYIYYGQALN